MSVDTVFGILTVEQWLAILRIGIGLIFGFLMPIALLVAIFLNLNYIALAGVKSKDKSVNPCYQCEQ